MRKLIVDFRDDSGKCFLQLNNTNLNVDCKLSPVEVTCAISKSREDTIDVLLEPIHCRHHTISQISGVVDNTIDSVWPPRVANNFIPDLKEDTDDITTKLSYLLIHTTKEVSKAINTTFHVCQDTTQDLIGQADTGHLANHINHRADRMSTHRSKDFNVTTQSEPHY